MKRTGSVLALDISTNAGWAYMTQTEENELPVIHSTGNVVPDKSVTEKLPEVGYPAAYIQVALELGERLYALVESLKPDVVVIEEINLGKNRYSQRTLEWIHFAFNLKNYQNSNTKVAYISSSTWRSNLGVTLSKEDKKRNAKLAKAKRVAREFGSKPDLKKLGIRGKVNKKHVAVRWVNETYGLQFKMKDNDRADAICQGVAYCNGAQLCDGSMTNHG